MGADTENMTAATLGPLSGGPPFVAGLGVRHIDSGDAQVYSNEMDLAECLENSAGQVHGGAIATLIDYTGGGAVIALTGRGGPTADLHVRYLSGVRSGPVRADARILKGGRQLVVVEVRVTDGDDRLVAVGDLALSVAQPTESQIQRAPD